MIFGHDDCTGVRNDAGKLVPLVNSLDTLTKSVWESFFFSAVDDYPPLQYGESVFSAAPTLNYKDIKTASFFFSRRVLQLFLIAICNIDLTIKNK